VGGGVVRVEMAPGLKLAPGALHQVRHHTVLAHGLAVQAIHTQGKQGTQRGPAEVLSTAVPLIKSPEHIAAAARATRERNASFMTVMLAGQYTDAYLENAGKDGSGLHSAVEHDCSVIAHETDVHSASDGFQRSLRARFQARLTPRVRLQNCFLDSEAW
jgi:beta-glucosidase